jgi:hypothetical protein
MRDLSKVQSLHKRGQGTHLKQAAEVEMRAMRQDPDAEAEAEVTCARDVALVI